MAYPLDRMTNAPQPVSLGGRTFPVKQLTLAEWGELQAWLKSVCPSPVAVALQALADLQSQGVKVPQPVQDAMFRQAQEESRRWPPKVGTMAWIQAIDSIEGGFGRFLRAALLPCGTDLDTEEAESLMERSTEAERIDLMRVCLNGEHVAPKAPGEPAPTTPPSPMNGDGSMNGSSSIIPAGALPTSAG